MNDSSASGLVRYELSMGERIREYFVAVPDGLSSPAPLVLAFHGGGSHARAMRSFCGLDELGREQGFITVFPNGTGRVTDHLSWNAGLCCGHARMDDVDDVGFVRAILQDLTTRAVIDWQRVFVAGMSNGGMFAYRLACEMSDVIAGVVSVAGPLMFDEPPARPVPVLHFHGTRDHFTPFDGGVGKRSLNRVMFRSVSETIERWKTWNHCRPKPQVEHLPDWAGDEMPITVERYLPAAGDGAELTLYTIEQGGHTWPGRDPFWPNLGPSTANLQANEVIGEFLARHHLPESAGA